MAGTISGKDRRANGIIAGIIVVALGLIVGSVLWQYMGAFFLAVTGYVFFSPLYRALRQKGFGKTFSGWATLIVAAVVIGIACLFTITVLANEMAGLFDPVALSNSANSLSASVSKLGAFMPGYLNAAQVQQFISSAMVGAANFLRASIVGCLESVGSLALGLLIIVFTFYYLLVAEGSIGKAREVIPFSRKNTDTLIREFKKILYSSIICTGLMAIAQAAPLTLVFIYFNVPGAIILGFIAAVLTCIPFTGIPFVWIPVALLELLGGNYAAAIGIILVGVIIAVLENFRPMLQNRIGEIHPMVALLGVIVGIVYFGVLGLLIGPILLSFTLLTARMFKEEYL